MNDKQRDRISKLLGMCTSAFDNEKLTALRKLQEMAVADKLTLIELIGAAFVVVVREEAERRPAMRPTRGYDSPILDDLADCEGANGLTTWEKGFVDSVLGCYDDDGELSDRQVSVAERIINKVQRRKAAERRSEEEGSPI